MAAMAWYTSVSLLLVVLCCVLVQMCRNGRLMRRHLCAGEQPYNARTQTCCQGVVHQKLPGRKCCQPGTQTYNPDSQTCCNGEVFDDKPQSSFRYFIGGVVAVLRMKKE